MRTKDFYKPTLSDIHLTDSLMKTDILKAVIAGDSLIYVRNQLYALNNDKSTDFHKYKANRNKIYKKLANQNWTKIKRSDKYYFGYINQEDKKRIVVLFDPKKVRPRIIGDVKSIGYSDPFVVDVENKRVYFGYFPMPVPEE